MAQVFKRHFKKLTLEQKLELIQRSLITPCAQRSTNQKLELLGRIQAPTLMDKAKFGLQFLSWKVQFAVIWALENKTIRQVIAVVLFAQVLLHSAKLFPSLVNTTIYRFLYEVFTKAFEYNVLLYAALIGVFLLIECLRYALQNSLLPAFLHEKGAGIRSVNHKYFLNAANFFITPSKQCEKLQKLLLQSINKAKINLEQNSFVNAHLPELMNQWLQLTDPSDTNTGSLQRLQ